MKNDFKLFFLTTKDTVLPFFFYVIDTTHMDECTSHFAVLNLFSIGVNCLMKKIPESGCLKFIQIYRWNATTLFSTINHVACILKEHESQGREGNRENHAKCCSRLKVPSVGAFTIFIGSLFYVMVSFTEEAAFLRSMQKMQWRYLNPGPRRSRSDGASKNSACGKSRRPENVL